MANQVYLSIAEQIITSRSEVTAIDPISSQHPEFDMHDAYEIQKLVNQHRIDQGGRVVGYKIGLTSQAVQQQLGVDQPDYGALFADMELLNGQTVDASQLIAPKAEGEIGFCFKEDLSNPNLTFMDVVAAIDFFFPVIEIVDSVVKDWKINIVDTVADNASSGLYMVSKKVFSPLGVDFEALSVEVEENGETVASGNGSACLGNPLLSTYWLAKKLIELNSPVRKGQIVLSGALAPMVNLQPGVEFKFKFKDLDEITLQSE